MIFFYLHPLLFQTAMNQLERIRELDRLIRRKETGNVEALAGRFDVCTMTIYRDLRKMREVLNLKITYDFELRSYVYKSNALNWLWN